MIFLCILLILSPAISVFLFSDTSRTLQKARGNFKKKLREFGGLDAVFEVARKCHSVMEVCACMSFFV